MMLDGLLSTGEDLQRAVYSEHCEGLERDVCSELVKVWSELFALNW